MAYTQGRKMRAESNRMRNPPKSRATMSWPDSSVPSQCPSSPGGQGEGTCVRSEPCGSQSVRSEAGTRWATLPLANFARAIPTPSANRRASPSGRPLMIVQVWRRVPSALSVKMRPSEMIPRGSFHRPSTSRETSGVTSQTSPGANGTGGMKSQPRPFCFSSSANRR